MEETVYLNVFFKTGRSICIQKAIILDEPPNQIWDEYFIEGYDNNVKIPTKFRIPKDSVLYLEAIQDSEYLERLNAVSSFGVDGGKAEPRKS